MVRDRFAAKLQILGYELAEWCIPPSERLVTEYQQRFDLHLPDDYREFLVSHGGAVGSANCRYLEPTPLGDECLVQSFYGFMPPDRQGADVRWATELIDGAPAVVAIAECYGGMVWLKCKGKDTGHVYMDDGDGRSAWPDQTFHDMFPGLCSEIVRCLELRRAGKLPKKPSAYQHVYLLATSFAAFIEALTPEQD